MNKELNAAHPHPTLPLKGEGPSRAWEWLGLAVGRGVVHGGMISTLADTAMGRSLRTLKPGVARAMSFDLKLNFINAAKVGESLRATGHVIHAGRRTAVTECRVEGNDGRLIATASATFALTRDKERSEVHAD